MAPVTLFVRPDSDGTSITLLGLMSRIFVAPSVANAFFLSAFAASPSSVASEHLRSFARCTFFGSLAFAALTPTIALIETARIEPKLASVARSSQ